MKNMNAHSKRLRAAALRFIEHAKQQPEVIGVVLTGSLVHGMPGPYSDVDVYLIWTEDRKYRERGNTWIDGVEIEYFQNPPRQVRAYFRSEKSPHTAHMLAKGELMYESDPVVRELIREAQQILAEPPAPPQAFQIELAKYHLDDIKKDLQDSVVLEDPLAVQLLRFQYLNACIDYFCNVHQFHRQKHKRLDEQLTQYDPIFTQIVRQFVQGAGIEALHQYMAGLLGGERTAEWVLRGPLDL